MDAPPSTDVSTTHPPLGRAMRAIAALEGSSKLAIVCVLFGWFFMNTLVVTLGSLQHGVRFFDMSAVIADPSRLFFDVDTPFHRICFCLICLLCLLAPLAPHLANKRPAWIGYLAPLALILVCGALLYSRSSGDFITAPADTKSVSGNFIRFANDLVHHGSDLVARHISVGAGGYLALIGSLVLAVQGVRGLRHAPR
jgi:hypothetical protein